MKRYQELHEKYKDKPEFTSSQYGDPFDGEKVSQLTSSFGPESESESDEEQNREPGDPGTSMPIMDPTATPLTPHTVIQSPAMVVSRPIVTTPASAGSRPPTKLRRIEPKPVPGGIAGDQPLAQAAVPHGGAGVAGVASVASSQAMTMPLTFVTVPQVAQQFHIQPTLQQQQQQQIQAQQLQLQHPQIQLQQSPMPTQHQPAQVSTHHSMLQSPSIHIEISPQQQAQLLSPVNNPTAIQQQHQPVVQQTQQNPTQNTSSKKEDKRKDKHKNLNQEVSYELTIKVD